MTISKFEANVILAVYIINIENFKHRYIYPYLKTINSFLRENTNSPFFKRIYSKYPNICGKYPYLQYNDLSESLDDLVEKGLLKEEISVTKKISYYPCKEISNALNERINID